MSDVTQCPDCGVQVAPRDWMHGGGPECLRAQGYEEIDESHVAWEDLALADMLRLRTNFNVTLGVVLWETAYAPSWAADYAEHVMLYGPFENTRRRAQQSRITVLRRMKHDPVFRERELAYWALRRAAR